MNSDRGHWYLLTALILGLILGLGYSWVVSPLTQKDTHPATLREDYQDVYRSLIARAYQANRNLPRARARLELLGDEEPALALAAQAQRSLAERGDQEMARLLADLSTDLRNTPEAAAEDQPEPTPTPEPGEGSGPQTPTGATGTAAVDQASTSATPTAETLSPTATATEAPPFTLQDQAAICNPDLSEPLIQVYATDAEGQGVPGVEIIVSWGTDNRETFFTGLKPDLGDGYADFEVEPGVTYTVELPENRTLVEELQVQQCGGDGEQTYWGSWEIYITHPN
jgi:hypothetical protein